MVDSFARLFDAPATRLPFHDTLFHAHRAKSLLAQLLDGLDGHDAIWAPAVGDDLAVLRQLREMALQLAHRHRARARNVAGLVFLRGAYVEHGHLTLAHALHEFVTGNRFECAASLEEGLGDRADFGEARGRELSHGMDEMQHGVVGEPIFDEQALLASFHQPRSPQHLQMLRRVGDAERGSDRPGLPRCAGPGRAVRAVRCAWAPTRPCRSSQTGRRHRPSYPVHASPNLLLKYLLEY